MKSEEKPIKISIANCAGRSNTGQMSLEIAKKLDKALPYANINCLPAIFPKLKPMDKFTEADAIVVIDGCNEHCVLETIKLGGYKAAIHVSVDDTFGIEKTPGLDYDEKTLNEIAEKVIVMVRELYEKLKEKKIQKTKTDNLNYDK
ncbi:MAG: putative zinc-binding protein [Bacteroidales bacterium]|nr:putative zinc-binding protein [Bacteroidales bacterium]